MASTLLLAMLRDCVSNAVRAAQLLRQREYVFQLPSGEFSMAALRIRFHNDGTYHTHRQRLANALLSSAKNAGNTHACGATLRT